VETYADKLAIFSLLDQLSDAAALGDVKAVKFLRDGLITCSTGGDGALYDAIHDVFYISGKWVRGLLDRETAVPLIQVACDRALAAVAAHQAAA
jgi:hypothetical protein